MSEYGYKITNYEAGAIFEVMNGVRMNYDSTPAMLTNSLFLDFLMDNGLSVFKGKSTRDVICIEFNYGSRDFEGEMKNIRKIAKNCRLERKIAKSLKDKKRITAAKNKTDRISYMYRFALDNQEKFIKKSADEIRELFYENGVEIKYPTYDRHRQINGYTSIKYKMLYRTPGKAKKGSVMFIRQSLYKKAHDFLWMGIKLPKKNAPIVEIGAYSSLVTSSIVDRVRIEPENILIIKDVDSFFRTNVISIETDENKHCVAVDREDYELKNTMFDGQALIDSSIFPTDGNGYILLRHHFCKMAAFCTNIQLFFSDYFGDNYDTAELIDMFGVRHLAKDIKLITTDNAVKWIKFPGVTYQYWCDRVHENGCMFGIVKTAHESKLGDVQRMSYQMVNALSEEIMDDVLSRSKRYIELLKTDNDVFIDYLKRNSNFSNDFEVLVAICEKNPEFFRCDYFRSRKETIIRQYLKNLRYGRAIQNADNLVIVGSPYAMLLHSVGEDPFSDPTFSVEPEATQCYTERFEDGEFLAEFRNPFNSRSNLGYLHNVYHPYFKKYFSFGKLIIAANMNGTDFQDRNNGSDMDSDSIYVTNKNSIVEHARYCVLNHPTIVNNIPKESNHYNNTMSDFALVDNNLSASQTDIGESSNLAQLCLTYTYNFNDDKYNKYVCILAVLAQAAIDSAKRRFDVDVTDEIRRIKKDIDVDVNGYPLFWNHIRPGFDQARINKKLRCPMNYIAKLKVNEYKPKETTLPISHFYKHCYFNGDEKIAKRVQNMIETFAFNLTECDTKDDYLLFRSDFDEIVEYLRTLTFSKKYKPLMCWLINRAFVITSGVRGKSNILNSTMDKNKSALLSVLYKANPELLVDCFCGNF